ncbi:hypothetical protein F4604DRAFT_1674896 [Suillus subluteus]|nr:hypothetical protein F4604DRAFT_1674896 [Suillus subluteus]
MPHSSGSIRITGLSKSIISHTFRGGIEIIKNELQLTDDDFPRFLCEECKYLESLKELPVRDSLCIRYVEVLDELAKRRADWDLACAAANNALNEIPTSSLIQINQISGNEYNRFKDEASISKYHAALDELEQLVIMRLFELSKLSLSGTGYKLQQQISKALQQNSETIRKAITRYSVQAAALNPLHPNISWKDIAEYGFLAEFDLLRHSRVDIRSDDWAKPAHREAMTKYFKLLRAHEEIVTGIIRDLLISDPLLGAELKCQWHSRAAINAVHSYRLDQIAGLTGFSGVNTIGVRLKPTADDHVLSGASQGSSGHISASQEDRNDVPEIARSDYDDMEAID